MQGAAKTGKPDDDPARMRRLKADAARPMRENLAEGIALSHALLKFAGSAKRWKQAAFHETLEDSWTLVLTSF